MTIDPTVHVAGVEKTQKTVAWASFFNQSRAVSHQGVAILREFLNIVDIVFALGTSGWLGKEISWAAT